jgi:hypothetical protein
MSRTGELATSRKRAAIGKSRTVTSCSLGSRGIVTALATTGTRGLRARYTGAAARTRSTVLTLRKHARKVTRIQFGLSDNKFRKRP